MPRDLLDERVNIELSQLQRETLDRYFRILIDASQFDAADDLRKAIEAKDRKREAA